LTSTIQLAKKLHYNALISKSTDKTKTAWNAIKSFTAQRSNENDKLLLNIRGKIVKNPQTLADTFNNYFTNVVKELVSKITKRGNSNLSQGSYMQYLDQAFPRSFPAIHMKEVKEKEINEIQKGLKWKRSSGYDEVPS